MLERRSVPALGLPRSDTLPLARPAASHERRREGVGCAPLPRKLARAMTCATLGERDFSALRAVDLACGPGRHLAHLAPGSLGIDRDPGAVDACRAAGLAAEVRDLCEPGWSAGLQHFEAALLADCLVHLERPDLCLAELSRILVPGAPVVVAEWVLPESGATFSPILRALACAIPGARAHWRHPEHLHRFSEAQIRELLDRSGFVLTGRILHSFPPALLTLPALEKLLGAFWPPRLILARRAR